MDKLIENIRQDSNDDSDFFYLEELIEACGRKLFSHNLDWFKHGGKSSINLSEQEEVCALAYSMFEVAECGGISDMLDIHLESECVRVFGAIAWSECDSEILQMTKILSQFEEVASLLEKDAAQTLYSNLKETKWKTIDVVFSGKRDSFLQRLELYVLSNQPSYELADYLEEV